MKFQMWLGRPIWVVAFVLLAAGQLFTGAAEVWAAEKVSIAIISFSPYAPWYIVKEKGFAKEIELDIRIIDGIREKNAAITSGKIQLMNNTLDSMVAARAAGVPIKVVAIPAMSYGLDEMVVTKEIRSVKDFPGKRFGADFGFLNHMWMLLTLKREGIPYDALKHVVVLPQESAGVFLSGGIDIDVNYHPFSMQSQRLPGSHVLKTSFTDKTWERGLISEGIACNEKWLHKKPEVAKELLRAWFEAVNWWKENPVEGDKIVARGLDWQIDDVKLTQHGAVMLTLDQNLGAFGIEDGKPLCMSIPEGASQPSLESSGWGSALFGDARDCVAGYIYDTWKLFNDVYLDVGVATGTADAKESLDPSILKALTAEGFRRKYKSNKWIGRVGL